jgi:hypothetical protein
VPQWVVLRGKRVWIHLALGDLCQPKVGLLFLLKALMQHLLIIAQVELASQTSAKMTGEALLNFLTRACSIDDVQDCSKYEQCQKADQSGVRNSEFADFEISIGRRSNANVRMTINRIARVVSMLMYGLACFSFSVFWQTPQGPVFDPSSKLLIVISDAQHRVF